MALFASISASQAPSFFSITSKALLAYGSKFEPEDAVRDSGRDSERCI